MSPGMHLITSTATGSDLPHKDSTFSLRVEAGKEYYLKIRIAGWGFAKQTDNFKLVSIEEGQKDVAKLKPPKVKAIN